MEEVLDDLAAATEDDEDENDDADKLDLWEEDDELVKDDEDEDAENVWEEVDEVVGKTLKGKEEDGP